MDDKEIVCMLFERDQNALKELTTKYGVLLKRVASGFIKDEYDIEECVNDTLYVAWNTIPPVQPNSLRAYLCRIVRNKAINLYKKNLKNTNEQLDSFEELGEKLICNDQNPDKVLIDKECVFETTLLLNTFLSSLPKKSRILFVRRYWFNEPYKELSIKFGIKETTLRSMLMRIKKQLAIFLVSKGVLHD